MKNFVVLMVVLFIASCNCKKNTVQAQTIHLSGDCPKDGTCSIQLFKNKSMEVKEDSFGKPYYDLTESPSQNVILYNYIRKVKGNLQDAGYREEIVFEIKNDSKNSIFTNESLHKTKMLYGRFCFCRGQTGYYKVSNGVLNITSQLNGKIGSLDFKVDKVPQIISHVDFIIK